MEDRGTALIAWDKVCQPKEKGGLRVLDIASHNKCLLMKHVHKFLNQQNIPWVKLIWETYYPDRMLHTNPQGSFWWKSILKLVPEFRQAAVPKLGSGNTVRFWIDNWNQGILKDRFPELFSFSRQEQISV